MLTVGILSISYLILKKKREKLDIYVYVKACVPTLFLLSAITPRVMIVSCMRFPYALPRATLS